MWTQRSCILLCMVSALCTFGPPEVPMSSAGQSQEVPEVQAWLVEEKLTLGGVRSEKFHIAVQIPPNHHAYLDKGDDGLLIPLTFTFTLLEQRGTRVVMRARPRGKRDEKFQATVLRGKGTFGFELQATQDTLPRDSVLTATLLYVLPATLLYQICNDVTEICYPPEEIEVPLHFTEQ